MTQPLRLILADDHQSIREGLRALFATVPGVEVVDDVADVETAVERVRTLSPDVLLLDLSMPKSGGLAAIRKLADEGASTAVVVLTRYRDEAFVREALAAGAAGYVLKQSPFSEVQTAVTQAARGDEYLDRQLVPLLARRPINQPGRVTAREGEVLRRAARGHSNKDVAEALGIAVKTVEVHKTSGMRKLSLRDRRDLMRYATLQGWLQEP
jgi:two-component system response regulator NreC